MVTIVYNTVLYSWMRQPWKRVKQNKIMLEEMRMVRGTLAVSVFSKMRKHNRPGLLSLGSPEIMQESRCLSLNQGTFDNPVEKKKNVNWKKSSTLNDRGPETLTNGED